jgi:hypothetical protein
VTKEKKWSWLADDIKIAQKYKVSHWRKLRDIDKFDENSDEKKWAKAFKIYKRRVNTRFLNPIDKLLGMYIEDGKEIYPVKGKGEGFSAVALQCVLIEFLGAVYKGLIYVTDPDYKNNEYNSAYESIYKPFLAQQPPFSNFFCNHEKPDTACSKVSAYTFYNKFRCGLIHEAATKGSSIIRGEKRDKDNNPIDSEHKVLIEKLKGKIILYRTPFQKALKQYLKNYQDKLLKSNKLKKAFLRKMDNICQIPKP